MTEASCSGCYKKPTNWRWWPGRCWGCSLVLQAAADEERDAQNQQWHNRSQTSRVTAKSRQQSERHVNHRDEKGGNRVGFAGSVTRHSRRWSPWKFRRRQGGSSTSASPGFVFFSATFAVAEARRPSVGASTVPHLTRPRPSRCHPFFRSITAF